MSKEIEAQWNTWLQIFREHRGINRFHEPMFEIGAAQTHRVALGDFKTESTAVRQAPKTTVHPPGVTVLHGAM
jgi:hypothetical protein